ncbi:hypothetical protein GCM10022258_40010 [Aquimarina gracilis]
MLAQFNTEDIGPSSYEVQLIPKNPDVADLGKFGNVPINKYNGTANVNIPIHDVEFEGLTIPLNLSYNTSGIRVNQAASWVGLGWNLSEGILITREINGFSDLRDDADQGNSKGWLFTEEYLIREHPYYDLEIKEEDLTLLNDKYNVNEPIDTEPDIFTVQLPSGSFKFSLPKVQNNEQIIEGRVINEKNYKVRYFLSDKTFEITDHQGFIYSFTNKEYSTGFKSWDADSSNTSELFALQATPPSATLQTRKLITSWKVSTITAFNGKELNFSYQAGFFMSFPHYSEYLKVYLNGNPSTPSNSTTNSVPSRLMSSINAFHNLYLTGISGDFGSINLELADRIDLFSKEAKARFAEQSTWTPSITPNEYSAKRLNKITVINSSNKTIKTAQFKYTYFNNDKKDVWDKERYLRLKLDEVQVLDQQYVFEYDHPNSLPPKDSKSTDFWNFYNGVENSARFPRSGRFYLIHPSNSAGTLDRPQEQYYKLSGASRKSDITYGKYGILTKVTYPTRGYTEFEYEGNTVTLKRPNYTPNYYSNPRMLMSSGVRSSEDYNFRYQYLKLANDPNYSFSDYNTCGITSESTSQNTEFEITDTEFCNQQDYNVIFSGSISCAVGCGQGPSPSGPAAWIENVDTGHSYGSVYYGGFDVNTSNISFRKQLMLPKGKYVYKTLQWSINSPVLVVATASAGLTVVKNSNLEEDVFEQFEVGGARLHKISNYDADGSFIGSKAYEYNEMAPDGLSKSSGKLMDDLVFTSKGFRNYEYTPEYFAEFPAPGASGGTSASPNIALIHSDNMIRSTPSASGSHVGYNQVTERHVDETGDNNGKTVCKYINIPNQYIKRNIGIVPQYYGVGSSYDLSYGEVYILAAQPRTHEYKNGSLIEKSIYDASGNLKRKIDNTYIDLSGTQRTSNPYPLLIRAGDVFAGSYPYRIVENNEYNNAFLRVEKSVIEEHEEDVLLTSNTYSYENVLHGYPTKQVGETSDGKVIASKMYYPQDLQTEPFISDLVDQNRVNIPIKTEYYKGTTTDPLNLLLASKETTFNNLTSDNNLVLPNEIKTAKGDDSTEDQRQIYEKYDNQGNLLQYRKSEGISITYVWSYQGQYPVAKIENATFAEVALALGISENSLTNFGVSSIPTLNSLRTDLPEAMVSTYTYDPLIGITSMTDPKGYTIYYSYDDVNRLDVIKDSDQLITNKYYYNYQGASGSFPSLGISIVSDKTTMFTNTTLTIEAGASGGSNNYVYQWRINLPDGQTQEGTSQTITLNSSDAPGVASVILSVRDKTTNVVKTTSKSINIYKPMSVSISVPSWVYTNTNTGFTSTVNGGSSNKSYKWTITKSTGYVTTGTGKNITFPSGGSAASANVVYTVTDNVTGDIKTLSNTINIYHPHSISNLNVVSWMDTNTTKTFATKVTGGSSTYSYKWEITRPDGSIATGFGYNIRFNSGSKTGKANLKLTVTDQITGRKVSATRTIDLYSSLVATSGQITRPVEHEVKSTASFNINPTGGSGNYSYSWTISGIIATHTSTQKSFNLYMDYKYYGNVTIKCTVKDNSTGVSKTASTTMNVKETSLWAVSMVTKPYSTPNNRSKKFQVLVNKGGGSGSFSHKWYVNGQYKGGSSTIDVTLKCDGMTNALILCKVKDRITGREFNVSRQFTFNTSVCNSGPGPGGPGLGPGLGPVDDSDNSEQ